MRVAFAACCALAICLTALTGCGGGGDDGNGPVVTPPGQDIRGTYRLVWFVAELYDDATCSILLNRSTPDDFASWSGSMVISDTTISQDYLLNGTASGASGSYTVTYTGDTTGVFHVVDGSGPHDIAFATAGNRLATDTGCLDFLGFGLREVDTWEKTSDFVARRGAQIHIGSELPLGVGAASSAAEPR
jgi:hypothetical protein